MINYFFTLSNVKRSVCSIYRCSYYDASHYKNDAGGSPASRQFVAVDCRRFQI